MKARWLGTAFLVGVLASGASVSFAARVSDIANTVHNLSASGPGAVKASSESRICVFCHTPHGAENVQGAPLWNRNLSTNTYTPYGSSSMDAGVIGAPTQGSSKLCLTCHDGTQAIGAVNTLNGSYTDYNPATAEIAMTGTGAGGVIPSGAGPLTGNTRNLGVNLTNDHPISFTYDTALAIKDGDITDPAAVSYIGNPSPGVRPELPLVNGKVECITCHDPHIRETTVGADIKFLRLNPLQTAAPTGTFNKNGDIICLGCHYKAGWADSSHARADVANEVYTASAAAARNLPAGTTVWQASCLNCHEAHTVQGARRLLRDGTDSTLIPKSGGNPALEEVCLSCHSSGNTVLTSLIEVPDIKTQTLYARRMPVRNNESVAGSEVHDIGSPNADVPVNTPLGMNNLESPLVLGKGNPNNRHAECTDCHHNHRMIRNAKFNDNPAAPAAVGTHTHSTATMHTNIASGVLRGTWGTEPVYGGGTAFGTPASSYVVKFGKPSAGASEAVTAPYVTREYQVCLKCHSNYAFDTNTPPPLGYTGGTPAGTNGMNFYTDQAMEFQSPDTHKGEVTGPNTGANALYATNNHRSWHPVMQETGRTKTTRTMTTNNTSFLAPWNGYVGSQSMYCDDCHGSNTANGTVDPPNGRNWGPHGSENNFILKGGWSQSTGMNGTQGDICFKCHSYTNYAAKNGCTNTSCSGFSGTKGALHELHANQIGYMRCSWCHVAVPHGWKNKALLVNLNDVGPEGGQPSGTEIANAALPYTNGPYYLRAYNKVKNFRRSGQWEVDDCTSRVATYANDGKKWMQDVCKNNP